MKTKKEVLIVLLLFFLSFLIRYLYISSLHIPFDYDQYEDIFLTKRIVIDKDFPVIGRPIYGDPNFHHGVAFFYLNIIPYTIFQGSPIAIALWISMFNSLAVIVGYSLGKSIFKSKKAGLITAIILATSFEQVQFSSWISSTTITTLTVPLVFFGLWKFIQGKRWGILFASFFVGLSIQFEIFFLYLLPAILIIWLVLSRKLPSLKLFLASVLLFVAAISTMIITELKLNFAGVKTLLHFSKTFDDSQITFFQRATLFKSDIVDTFSLNLNPTKEIKGEYLALIILSICLFTLFKKHKNNREKSGLLFALLYFLSPALMVLMGYHRQPWFLIGILTPLAFLSAFAISKLKNNFLVSAILSFVVVTNLISLNEESKTGTNFFKLENSSILASQIEVMNYMFASSKDQPFAFNAVNYPLYHNALWEYHFSWYGKKLGHIPSWLGSDQIYPYKILPTSNGSENIFFLIINNTYRIPDKYKQEGVTSAQKQGNMVEEKEIGGFTVQKYKKKL